VNDSLIWMPTVDQVQEQADLHLGWADEEAMDFIQGVGIRAQIAVLEQMRTAFLATSSRNLFLEGLEGRIRDLREEIEEEVCDD